MLGEIGCEVTTLGNHEFDYRSEGLSNMLKTAAASGDTLPELVVCNVDWEAMENQGLNEGQQAIKDGFEAYGVKDYVMLQKGDVSVAVIGVFGNDSLACAPTCELLFRDPVEAVKETVAKIREKEDADMIVCVSHSGTWEDEDKSEDEILAKSVPELDLIISGHTHTELPEPIVHGNTYIVSAGEYGKRLGSLHMEQNEDGRWSMESYELITVTSDIEPEQKVQEKADSFLAAVDAGYLSDFGYTREQVLAQNDVEFSDLKELETEHTEQNLGSIIADAYVEYNSETFYQMLRITSLVDEHLLEKFYRDYGVWVAQTPSLSVIDWGRYAFDSDEELVRFAAMHGHELVPLLDGDYAAAEEYSLTLPEFPAEGSVVDMGDYIIVHF